jgi:HTH-type transcriptional regulator / antitoxin HigA
MVEQRKEQAFAPDEVTPPGDTLREMIEHAGMTQVELAERSGLDKKTINLIVQGKAPVTQETALAFEKIFRLAARFWMALETQYAEQQARAQQRLRHDKRTNWAQSFPYSQMAKWGWVPATQSASEKTQHLLSFFGVAAPANFESIYGDLSLSYRKSPKVKQKKELVAAWLRAGEIAASKAQITADYDEELFVGKLATIRKLTSLEDPNEIVSKIKTSCAEAGVIFVMVPELPGLGISGVMRWLNKRPLIQQCLRFRTNDQFWFTFFHEARHVLQKCKGKIFVESEGGEGRESESETDADTFAGEFLIPPAKYARFCELKAQPGSQNIRVFAKSINVHPAIVVGRLQRDEILSWSHPAKNLKLKYSWAEKGK